MKENKEVADTNVGDIEEAIERLEYIDRTYSYNNYYSIWDLKCIEILLSAYKRVLKENEELKEELETEQNERLLCHIREKQMIPVQKIKDKIEYLEHYIEENSDEQGYWGNINPDVIYGQIEILEELLESEE